MGNLPHYSIFFSLNIYFYNTESHKTYQCVLKGVDDGICGLACKETKYKYTQVGLLSFWLNSSFHSLHFDITTEGSTKKQHKYTG